MSSSSIIGYVDPLIVSPGARVAVKVSCDQPTFSSKILRLLAGFDHPDAPPIAHQLIKSIPQQSHQGKPQFSRTGSYIRVPSWGGTTLSDVDSLSISFWCQATLPEGADHAQFLFSSFDSARSTGFACFLDETGNLSARIGGPGKTQGVLFSIKLSRHQWYHVNFAINRLTRKVQLRAQAKNADIGKASLLLQHEETLAEVPLIASSKPLVIASDSIDTTVAQHPRRSATFNGKIDGFKLETVSNGRVETMLDCDFSLAISSDKVHDISGKHRHGTLINAPARAVTSHDWDASHNDWTRASYGYGAIHFHDDDLDDAAWETSFELQIPPSLRSGCYGVHVDDGITRDIIPFFVRPDMNTVKAPLVALIMPTFTYMAYANEHLYDETREVHFAAEKVKQDKYFETLKERPDLGISLYDGHSDGSGTCYSSSKRPILNMRPDYSFWAHGGPRGFSADLWYIGFLERELGEQGYDLITDHDLSEYGAPLLKRYKVLLSGSHPEYPTYDMLNSYASFFEAGGHFMYLGGNGYYWVTAHDRSRSHRIEVRRADQGCRTFGLAPGNWHHSLTGELGGLWRTRGRPPNQLFGIGSCAMGVADGVGYGITEEARSDPRLAFLFHGAGLESAEIIGNFGIVQAAASGDEIDRLDYNLGTPGNAVIIATSKLAGGHSDDYLLFNEESMFPMTNTTGTTSDKIRSDLVFFETATGGAVFSVGSMNWVGALAWKNYENNIAQMTGNALHEFIERGKRARAS